MTNKVLSKIIGDLSSSCSKEELISVLVDEFGCNEKELSSIFSASVEKEKKKHKKGITIEPKKEEELQIEIDKVIKYIKQMKDVTVEQLCHDCLLNEEVAYEIIKILEDNELVEQKIPLLGKNRVIWKKAKTMTFRP